MRKMTGSAAGVFALLAVFLHTQFAPQSETTPGTEKATLGGGVEHNSPQTESDESIEGPWIATRDYFQVHNPAIDPSLVRAVCDYLQDPKAGPDAAPGNLQAFLGVDQAPKPAKMWSLIATVPDPLHTRMALYLDFQIEAIERSLQDAGWEFAGQWLPWNDHFSGSERDINQRRRQRRLQALGEEMPGVLVFRAVGGEFPARRLLFVWLVPETATSGIAGRPFRAALKLADAFTSREQFTSGEKKVGLLSPTFSGSFSSLTFLVKEWQDGHPAEIRLSSPVYSASASNANYGDAFKQATRLDFHGGIVDAQDYLSVFCEVLDEYRIPQRDAVLLREDETGYSNSFKANLSRDETSTTPVKGRFPCSLRNYRFPRDISRLRNAYQEGASTRDAYSDPSWSLNFSIRDPNSGEDSIPTFSEVQTPLAQDAILESIMREFKRNGTRIVLVAASNSLDVLFLMKAIRREAPDTRILIHNPEIMAIPAASRDPLSGTILLSTYPMFADGDDWLDTADLNDKIGRLTFADSTIQGVYNVTQLLLHDIHVVEAPLLRGYRQFEGGHRYPGMWLLTLNRFGFQPLDYHNHQWRETHGKCGPNEDCGWLRRNPVKALAPFPKYITYRPLSWRISVLSVNMAALMGSLLFVWCNLASLARKPYWLAITEGFGLRLQALLGVTLSLTAIQWILISPALFPLDRFFVDNAWKLLGPFLSFVAVVALCAPIAGFSYILLLVGVRGRHNLLDRHSWRFGIRGAIYPAIMGALFLFIAGTWYRLCYRGSEGAFFFRYRSLDLYSGSSPAAPLVILSAVFFFVSLFYFKRYTVAGPNRPQFTFTAAEDDSSAAVAFQKRLRCAIEALDQCVLAPAQLTLWAAFRRTGIGLIFLLFCVLILRQYPFAAERYLYNIVVWVELGLVLFWLAIGCYDFTLMWRRLATVLDLVELLRLQPALRRVARDWPRRPAWDFRRSVAKHRLNRQMRYALHGRVVALQALAKVSAGQLSKAAAAGASGPGLTSGTALPVAGTTVEMAEADFRAFEDAIEPRPRELPTLGSIARGVCLPGAAHELRGMESYQTVSAGIAARILQLDLRPWWRQSLEEDDSQDPPAGNENQESAYLKCCSNFVALQCCRYVAYGVEHVQRAASCVSVGFLLLLVFFNSYSPQGPQSIARFLALTFLAIGYLMVRVLAQMERNPILSRMSRTNPGELNAEFWVQLLSLGGLPLIGVLAHLFPSVSQFLVQWVAPGIQASR